MFLSISSPKQGIEVYPMQGVMHEVPMFVCSLFHQLIALPVNTVVKKNTIVLNVPLSHGIVLAEAHGVV